MARGQGHIQSNANVMNIMTRPKRNSDISQLFGEKSLIADALCNKIIENVRNGFWQEGAAVISKSNEQGIKTKYVYRIQSCLARTYLDMIPKSEVNAIRRKVEKIDNWLGVNKGFDRERYSYKAQHILAKHFQENPDYQSTTAGYALALSACEDLATKIAKDPYHSVCKLAISVSVKKHNKGEKVSAAKIIEEFMDELQERAPKHHSGYDTEYSKDTLKELYDPAAMTGMLRNFFMPLWFIQPGESDPKQDTHITKLDYEQLDQALFDSFKEPSR